MAAADAILDQIQSLADSPTNARSLMVGVYDRGVKTVDGQAYRQRLFSGLHAFSCGRNVSTPLRISANYGTVSLGLLLDIEPLDMPVLTRVHCVTHMDGRWKGCAMIQRIAFTGCLGSLLNYSLLSLSHPIRLDTHRRRKCESWQIMDALMRYIKDGIWEDKGKPIDNTKNTAIIWYNL